MPISHVKTNAITDWTQADLDAQIALGNFPEGTVLADIVLPSDWNADHTAPDIADVTGLEDALDAKAPLASPTFTGTVSGVTAAMVGLGNVNNTSDADKPISTATQSALDAKAPLNSPTFTGTVSGITAAMVGAPSGSGTSTGTNTGDQTSVSGNAGTATALQTPRTINGVSFNGTADITVTAAAGTLTGTTLASGVVSSSLTSVGTIATGVWQGTAITDTYIASASTWNAKQDALVSGTNIKTVNGNSLLGSGNVVISASAAWGGITGTLSSQTDLQTALDAKVNRTAGELLNPTLLDTSAPNKGWNFDFTGSFANAIGTHVSWLTDDRTWTWQDKNGTVAFTSDIIGLGRINMQRMGATL